MKKKRGVISHVQIQAIRQKKKQKIWLLKKLDGNLACYDLRVTSIGQGVCWAGVSEPGGLGAELLGPGSGEKASKRPKSSRA